MKPDRPIGPRRSTATVAPVIPERIRPIVGETNELARRFVDAGYRVYLVGGPVRDAIAGAPGGKEPFGPDTDLDLTTDARPEEIERLVDGWADRVWLQGKRFGTIGASHRGRRFEITTHRAEVYVPESRKPEVRFGDDVVTDLSRRDFTVNAMALSLPDLELIDPFDGLADLASRTLRTPLDPQTSFSDDALRTLRAARFIAGYELTPTEELTEAARRLAGRLSVVSAERIRDELNRLIVLPDPEAGLWFVVTTGLADQFLPEIPALALEQDSVHRHKDVLAHTIAVVGKTRPDEVLRLAALLHDIGKPQTRAYGPDGVSFYHHDIVGARHGATPARSAALSPERDRRGQSSHRAALEIPYLQDGLDRLCAQAVRARRWSAPRASQRAHARRLHDAQRGARRANSKLGWTISKRGSRNSQRARRSTRSDPNSTATK